MCRLDGLNHRDSREEILYLAQACCHCRLLWLVLVFRDSGLDSFYVFLETCSTAAHFDLCVKRQLLVQLEDLDVAVVGNIQL